MATGKQSKVERAREARAARKRSRERFMQARRVTKTFERQLRGVAEQVGRIVSGFAPKGIVKDISVLRDALHQYSQVLRPWAQAVSEQMLAQVAQRDSTAWIELGRDIGHELREELRRADMREALKQLQDEQVELITSLPVKAAERVHKLAVEAHVSGARAAEVAKEIMRTGAVTKSRAMLIARTEVSRTGTAITEQRAAALGSTGYIWRTAGDSDVRHTHKKLEGKFIEWNNPPIAGSNGERAHAGAIYNCRCWPEPVLPDV